MNKKIMVLLVLLICFCLIGCENAIPLKGEKILSETEDKIPCSVGVIFEYDGVRVYRFTDCGEARYFARVIGQAEVSVFDKYTESNGKSSTTHVHETMTIK